MKWKCVYLIFLRADWNINVVHVFKLLQKWNCDTINASLVSCLSTQITDDSFQSIESNFDDGGRNFKFILLLVVLFWELTVREESLNAFSILSKFTTSFDFCSRYNLLQLKPCNRNTTNNYCNRCENYY